MKKLIRESQTENEQPETKKKKLVRVIHHLARPRDSQCLYGAPAWDEYVYE